MDFRDQIKYPLFLFDRINRHDSFLDKAVRDKDIIKIKMFMDFFTKSEQHPVLNYVIDRNLITLLGLSSGILKDYLQCDLVNIKLQTYFSSNDEEKIIS